MVKNETEDYKGYHISYMIAIDNTTWVEIRNSFSEHVSTYVSKNKTEAQAKAHLWISQRKGDISHSEYERKISKFLR